MATHVLALSPSGLPREWITVEEAVTAYACAAVVWDLGALVATYRGGVNAASGVRSVIEPRCIVAIRGHDYTRRLDAAPAFSAAALFARDRHVCCYCGERFPEGRLTVEHIVPVSRGGRTDYRNCCAACEGCNNAKGDRRLEECGLSLLYVPYVPNFYEAMILRNRNTLADQMDFLLARVPRGSRLRG